MSKEGKKQWEKIPVGAASWIKSRPGMGMWEIFSPVRGTIRGWGAGILAGTGTGNLPLVPNPPRCHPYQRLNTHAATFFCVAFFVWTFVEGNKGMRNTLWTIDVVMSLAKRGKIIWVLAVQLLYVILNFIFFKFNSNFAYEQLFCFIF